MLRRPWQYVAALVVGLVAAATGLPWWVAISVAVVALVVGALLAAALFALAAPTPEVPLPFATLPAAGAEAAFRIEGEYWTIAFHGPAFRLVDSKGLRYIHRLLQTPGVEVWAPELESLGQRPSDSHPRTDEALHPDAGGGGQPVLDEQALQNYRRRIAEIQDELEEAERNNDPGRAARAREEMELLMEEIQRATRPGGGPTTFPGEAERARVNVTRAIKAAIEKVREHDASLGHHLHHDIRTGTFCVYEPDPASVPDWVL